MQRVLRHVDLTVRGMVNDRKGQERESGWLSWGLEVLPVLAAVAMFLPWDVAGRTSFALLATAERTGLFPKWFPMTPVLMWWVLLPVLLLGASVLEVLKVRTRRVGMNTPLVRAMVQLSTQLSVFGVAFGVSQAPVAGFGATVAMCVSAVGVLGTIVGSWAARRG